MRCISKLVYAHVFTYGEMCVTDTRGACVCRCCWHCSRVYGDYCTASNRVQIVAGQASNMGIEIDWEAYQAAKAEKQAA